MDYYVAYHTDVGLRKHTNQDSLAVKMMDTPKGRAVLAIVCDGMGGLSDGELASKEVITAYSNGLIPNLCRWHRRDSIRQNRFKRHGERLQSKKIKSSESTA